MMMEHQNNYNLLRHLAALFVLYAHAITANGEEEFFYRISGHRLELAGLGVQIFFIISGYLVTKSLFNSNDKKSFVIKRISRLWPALIAVTTSICLIVGPIFTTLHLPDYFTSPETWKFFFRNTLFLPYYQLPGVFNGLPVNSSFWTLLFEILCYGLLMVVGKKIMSRVLVVNIGWIIMASVRLIILNFPHLWPARFENYSDGVFNLMFLFASAAAWYVNTCKRNISAPRIYLCAIVLFFITIFVVPSHNIYASFLSDICLMIFIVEFGKASAVMRWPSWDVSYGMYLMGWTVQMCLSWNNKIYAFSLFLQTLLITIPLAFLSWYVIEKPFLRRGKS